MLKTSLEIKDGYAYITAEGTSIRQMLRNSEMRLQPCRRI